MNGLMKCKDCNHDISVNAHTCPKCGSPINQPILPKTKKEVKKE